MCAINIKAAAGYPPLYVSCSFSLCLLSILERGNFSIKAQILLISLLDSTTDTLCLELALSQQSGTGCALIIFDDFKK